MKNKNENIEFQKLLIETKELQLDEIKQDEQSREKDVKTEFYNQKEQFSKKIQKLTNYNRLSLPKDKKDLINDLAKKIICGGNNPTKDQEKQIKKLSSDVQKILKQSNTILEHSKSDDGNNFESIYDKIIEKANAPVGKKTSGDVITNDIKKLLKSFADKQLEEYESALKEYNNSLDILQAQYTEVLKQKKERAIYENNIIEQQIDNIRNIANGAYDEDLSLNDLISEDSKDSKYSQDLKLEDLYQNDELIPVSKNNSELIDPNKTYTNLNDLLKDDFDTIIKSVDNKITPSTEDITQIDFEKAQKTHLDKEKQKRNNKQYKDVNSLI